MPSAFLSCCPCQKRDLSGRLSRIHFCDLMYVNGMVFIPHVIIAVFQRSSIRPSAKHLQRLCVHTFPPCARYESMPEAVQGFTAKNIVSDLLFHAFPRSVPCGLRVRRVSVVSMGSRKASLSVSSPCVSSSALHSCGGISIVHTPASVFGFPMIVSLTLQFEPCIAAASLCVMKAMFF